MDEQTRPSAIVREETEVALGSVAESSVAELLTVCIARMGASRYKANVRGDGEVAREYSLAITHAEDAITRANKAHYREAGIFAITDAERTA